MKLAPRTFRIQWELHAWAGVLASLFLFVIFFCGIFALFREDLEVWQAPAFHSAPPGREPLSFAGLLDRVRAHAALPPGAHLGVLTHEEMRLVTVYLYEPGGLRVLWLDPLSGEVFPEHSRLASELYWMHFFYRVPGGEEFSGVVAMALLVTLVSGLVIHLKDLRQQWWRFRPEVKPRFSASDAHKVLGVFGLPFTAMMGWTGAVLCLAGLASQGVTTSVFRGDAARVDRLRGFAQLVREEAHREAVPRPLEELVARARAAVPGARGTPRYVELNLWGDANAWAAVYFQLEPLGADHFAFLDAVSGATLATSLETHTPAFGFERVLFDLHAGRYGGVLAKGLGALLALAMCAVLLTGNLIWLERRDAQRSHPGNRVLERLTVGVSAGLVLATAVYFTVNRVLPDALPRRDDWEFGLFLGAWLAVVVGCLLLRLVPRRMARGLCAGAAVLFVGVVLGDIAREPVHLFTALGRGLPSVFFAEGLLCALALGCGGLAWGLGATRNSPR